MYAQIYTIQHCAGVAEHLEDEKGETCSRPDCNFGADASKEYFIERIIGRADHKKDGIARFSWLIKWEGCVQFEPVLKRTPTCDRYPANESTWTPHAELGNVAKLIKDFETTAKQEGLKLKRMPLVLLQQAVDAGWAIKKERKLVST